MDYNFHAHTYRCSHASGTPEEYVIRAIENGVKCFGFSDHFPFIHTEGYEAKYRVPVAEVGEYRDEILSLREKYSDKIDIKIGFEMEYYPEHFDKMLADARRYGAEYLILGQHFLEPEHPGAVPSGAMHDDPSALELYSSLVETAIRSGHFTYIAHPDIFNFAGDDGVYDKYMRRVCVASRECSVPLEINFLGIRDGRRYPHGDFWRIVGEEGAPVTFGFDSHSTEAAYDEESLEAARRMVEKYALNYIGMPRLVNP